MRIPLLFLFLLRFSSSQLQTGSCDEPNICAANGTCRPGKQSGTFWCDCADGYGGDLCQLECNLGCRDDEKCIFDEKSGDLKCGCKDCVYGAPSILTNSTDPCSSKPCNHGRCYPFGAGYQCLCDNGFGGSFCDQGKDHCLNHSCTNGSVCVNTATDYQCACPAGKMGTFCEKTSCALLGNVCNGGKCIDTPKGDKPFLCECPEGYEGEFCTQDKNECLNKDICLNNGTCINVAGGYVCDCRHGYTGKICGDPVDRCLTHKCSNGGECGRLPDQSPVCMCPQGYAGPRCEHVCPRGYGGHLCTLPLNKPHCSRSHGRCFNGGVCLYGFCKCPPEFYGDSCEHRRQSEEDFVEYSSCSYRPCENNSTCVEMIGRNRESNGYSCICQPGFYGRDCERQLACAPTTCANGGQCIVDKSGLTCKCPIGFYGEYCEKKEQIRCDLGTCRNGGVCLMNKNGEDGKCDCKYGFTGTRCQEVLVIEKPKEVLVKDLCKHRNCSSLASNGVCNPECNLLECNFDGGDCSGGQQPFSKCRYPSRCADLFANGICNQECNNEACLYDGLDCQSELYRCPARIRQHCIERRGDGICDRECSSIGCGFDGGDCNDGSEALILNDIRIKVQLDPFEFQMTGGERLMQISAHLRATVRIQTDSLGPLVFKWDGMDETDRVNMDPVELDRLKLLSHNIRKPRGIQGIVLYLEVEEVCQPVSTCRFTTAQSVVDLISAGLIKTDGRTSLGLPIMEAIVATPRRIDESINRDQWSRNKTLFYVVIGFLVIGTIVAGVIVKTGEPERSRKRKIINAPVWMPPTDPGIDSRKKKKPTSIILHPSQYFNSAKRYRHDSDDYSQIYPQTLANGYPGEYQYHPSTIIPMEPVGGVESPPEEISLHVEAAGPGPITCPINYETVNQADSKYRRRVLHWLAGNTNGKPEDMITEETVKCLKAGAEVNVRDCDENTPLMLAVKSRRVRLAVVLLKAKANPTIFNKSERSALHEAVANKDVRMVTNLLTDNRLLREIDELDRNGMTALMIAASSLGENQVAVAKLLIEKGAKVDADGGSRKDSEKYNGRSALHFAALADNLEMARYLLSRNANIDKQDDTGRTPLMLAAREGHEKTVRFLVEQNARKSVLDNMDKNASQHAKEGYHMELGKFLEAEPEKRTLTAITMANRRRTPKEVKRSGSRCTHVSRESTNTPTSSESSSYSSNPSPQYFQTNSSTPSRPDSSPEYPTNPEWTNPAWYTNIPDGSHQAQISPDSDQLNGSFYF